MNERYVHRPFCLQCSNIRLGFVFIIWMLVVYLICFFSQGTTKIGILLTTAGMQGKPLVLAEWRTANPIFKLLQFTVHYFFPQLKLNGF